LLVRGFFCLHCGTLYYSIPYLCHSANPMNIRFDNITLRPLDKNDATQLLALIDRNRPRLLDYFPVTSRSITDINSSKYYIKQKIAEAAKREHYTYVIEDDSKTLQGIFILKNIDWWVPKGELAYFIDKDLEGKGIMTKVMAEMVRYCFDTLEMNKLFILTSTDNYASRKIAEKNGFKVEGILRKNYRIPTGLVDNIHYGLLRGEE
jgi:ribosomal-protein-serine acetyltransferase